VERGRGNEWKSKRGCYLPARRRKKKVDDGRRILRRRCRRHKVEVLVGEVIIESYSMGECPCILSASVSVT